MGVYKYLLLSVFLSFLLLQTSASIAKTGSAKTRFIHSTKKYLADACLLTANTFDPEMPGVIRHYHNSNIPHSKESKNSDVSPVKEFKSNSLNTAVTGYSKLLFFIVSQHYYKSSVKTNLNSSLRI
jgi:hypothetical protein